MNNPLPKAEPDFLQRLVSRALDEDSAIEPRLPSMFEPASVSSPDAGAAWQDAPAHAFDQAVEDRAGDGDVEAGRPQAKADPTPMLGHDVLSAPVTPVSAEPMPLAKQPDPRPAAARDAGRPQTKVDPTPILSHDVPSTAAIPKRLEPMPLAKQPDPRPAAARDAEPPPQPLSSRPAAAVRRRSSPVARNESAASAEHVPPKVVDVVLRELHPAAGDVAPREGRLPTTGPDHREASPPRMASRDVSGMDERANPPARTDPNDTRGTLVPVSTAAAQRIVVAAAAPYRPPRDQAPVGQTDAAPVVNVTIGRLEVRAVPAGAMAKPHSERRGAQPMTLDDYFKQRRGER